MTSFEPKFMSLCEEMYDNEEDEEDKERSEGYCKGGYHRVEIGDSFYKNRYRVVKKLGWGAFSTVWLCADTKARKYVAIKIVKSKKSFSELAFEEIQMLSDVQRADPNDPFSHRVVSFFNHFTIKGVNGKHRCLVFEALGHSLYKFMMSSFSYGIPIGTVKRIARQILEGLQYLHTKCKLIHTDIKPENILLTTNQMNERNGKTQLPNTSVSTPFIDYLTKEAQSIENMFNLNQIYGDKLLDNSSDIFDEELSELSVKIADLGNACYLDESHSSIIQTRPYRSPEVILGLGYDTSADIWSTACTLFELATGQLLFNPNHKQQSCRNDVHLTKIIELLGPLPNRLKKGKHYTKYFSKSGHLLRSKVTDPCSLSTLLVTKYRWAPTVAQSFAQFLLPMLEMDPKKRVTAADCLSHSWLTP